MQTKIENEKEFTKTIDQYGAVLDAIAAKKAEAGVLKLLLEAYANENGILRHSTGTYELAMKKGRPSLRLASTLKEEDVIALLKKSETGSSYLFEGYDSAALKRDFGGTAAGRDKLSEFGLVLTEPGRHAEVRKVG